MERLKELFAKSKSVTVTESANGKATVVISRASRFIRRDAEKLLARFAEAGFGPDKIIVSINAPLCSKAGKLLQENGYTVSEKLVLRYRSIQSLYSA